MMECLGRRPKFFFSPRPKKLLGLRPEKKFRPSAKIVVIFWGVPWLLRGGSIFSWKDLTIFFWDRKKNWAFGTKIPYFRWQNQNFTPLSVYDVFKGRNKANQLLVGNGISKVWKLLHLTISHSPPREFHIPLGAPWLTKNLYHFELIPDKT